MITLNPSLTGLRGTQVTGSIIYTLVTIWGIGKFSKHQKHNKFSIGNPFSMN
jgi:hypothetical protein